MSRWFIISSTQASATYQKSAACRKREIVLEELCRFKTVESHRSKFAIRSFVREAFVSLIFLLLLMYTIFEMLGLDLSSDQGSDLYAELRKSLVLNDFDEAHNTFYEIANWEGWWNFCHHSLVPMLTAQQIYHGLDYSGDLRVSPILIRQVRVEADKSGLLPVWGPGTRTDVAREAKAPLKIAMCLEQTAGNTPQQASNGCVWSNPSGYLSAYTQGQQFRQYPSSGYVVQLTKENISERLDQLQRDGWFDAATRFVSVETMVYSKSRNRMAYVNLGAEISVTGLASPVVRILTFKPAKYGFEHLLYMIVFVQSLGNEALCLFDLGPKRYFMDFSNIVNLFMAGCIFSVFVCQMELIRSAKHFGNGAEDPWNLLSSSATDLFDMDYILITMVQVQRVCAALATLVSVLKFLTHFTTLPVSGPIVLGIFELLRQPAVPLFLICYFWMLSGFAFFFLILSTDAAARDFRHVWISMVSMIRAGLAGDFDFSVYEDMDATTGPIGFLFMIVLSQIIMTNLLIAIISSEYDLAKKKGERIWKNRMALCMAVELVQSIPVDSSGQIDMLSSVMLVGHDIQTGGGGSEH